jgi:hypothetical protein
VKRDGRSEHLQGFPSAIGWVHEEQDWGLVKSSLGGVSSHHRLYIHPTKYDVLGFISNMKL